MRKIAGSEFETKPKLKETKRLKRITRQKPNPYRKQNIEHIIEYTSRASRAPSRTGCCTRHTEPPHHSARSSLEPSYL